jgi:hypothetical protein
MPTERRSNRLPAPPPLQRWTPPNAIPAPDPRPWWTLAAMPRLGFWLVRERLPRKQGEVGRAQWGPLLPAKIERIHTTYEPGEKLNTMERSPFFAAFVAGEPVSLYSLQQETHTAGDRIFRVERTIDRAEHDWRVADAAWAREFSPEEPEANPNKAVDLTTIAPIF